jgi:hypothetical protein
VQRKSNSVFGVLKNKWPMKLFIKDVRNLVAANMSLDKIGKLFNLEESKLAWKRVWKPSKFLNNKVSPIFTNLARIILCKIVSFYIQFC